MDDEQTPVQIEAVVIAVEQSETALSVAPEQQIAPVTGIARLAPAMQSVTRFMTSPPVKKAAQGAALVALGVGLELVAQKASKSIARVSPSSTGVQRQSAVPQQVKALSENQSLVPGGSGSKRRLIYREIFVYRRIEHWIDEP